MRSYNFLFQIFPLFSKVLQIGWDDYRDVFMEQVDCGHIDLYELGSEFTQALEDNGFQWKKHLEEHNFFLYDEHKTRDELIIDLKLLCWDVVFPELVLNQEDQKELKDLVCEVLFKKNILSFEKTISEAGLFESLVKANQKWCQIDIYELLRLQKFIALNEIAVRHESGTNKWFFYLMPEQNSF